ncbi:hypothetical protein D3C84_661550 [compost metagenome]
MLLRFTEETVMFAFDLREAVTHAVEEAVVGRQHVASEVELDHRRRAHQRADQVLVFTGCLDGAGQVTGVNREMLDPPVPGAHRLHNRTQPGLLAIATQQAHRTGKVLASGQRSLEAVMEFVGLHVNRNDVFDRTIDQVVALVEHLAEKILIDRLNPPVGIQGQDQHLAFQTFLHLLKAGEFFAKSRQLLLQAFVEHGKAPMDRDRKRHAA